jgi:acylglycerol lipase
MNNFILFNNKFKLNIIYYELNNPKAILINIHGFGMHFQSENEYLRTLEARIESFNPLKILSYGLELRGHGKSDGLKYHIHDYNDYLSDIHTLVLYIREKYNLPIYLLGESLVAALSIIYSIKYKNISGVILLGPMIDIVGSINDLLINAVFLISYIVPKWKIIKPSDNIMKEYKNIKKCVYTSCEPVMLCSGRECYKIIKWIKANKDNFMLPVLAIHSIDDGITSYKATKEFIDNCKSTDKTFISLPGNKHSILLGNDIDKVLNIIYNWLDKI